MSGIFSPLTDGDLKRIAVVLLLIFFNFTFAVLGAMMRGGFDPTRGGFDFKKLPEFVYNQILPYIVGLAFFEAFLHILPPSTLVGGLFGNTNPTDSPIPVDPSAGWQWLDPTVLWATYAAIVLNLAKQTFTNLVYLFGKGLTLAQSLAVTKDKPAA